MTGEILTVILCAAASREERAATASELAEVARAGGTEALSQVIAAGFPGPRRGSRVIDVRDGRRRVFDLDEILPERVVYLAP